MVANLVLLANIVLLAALLTMFKAALSLPGIAGMVLTVGMAVDANVLIYERIREELRNGVTPQKAIASGFEKAFSAIADSNVTTLIAGIVLWVFGTGPIRGFAVVLSLGIATSMFTSLARQPRAADPDVWRRTPPETPVHLTRQLTGIQPWNSSNPTPASRSWERASSGTRLSAVLIVGSLLSLGIRGLNLGIDFTGGTTIEVHFPVEPNRRPDSPGTRGARL